MKVLLGFKEFIARGNVVELAVAVVIGAAFTALVSSMVEDLMTPIIAALIGEPDFSALSFTINNSEFTYGNFINALIAFMSVAVAVYFFVVAPMNAYREHVQDDEDATHRDCPACLSEVSVKATRCAYCTSELKPPKLESQVPPAGT
ncbi:MAG: large conductance mechanosensitive channel protein MscL [Solirubrobacterales bacterium]